MWVQPPVGPMHDPVPDDFRETTALWRFTLAVFSQRACGSSWKQRHRSPEVHSTLPARNRYGYAVYLVGREYINLLARKLIGSDSGGPSKEIYYLPGVPPRSQKTGCAQIMFLMPIHVPVIAAIYKSTGTFIGIKNVICAHPGNWLRHSVHRIKKENVVPSKQTLAGEITKVPASCKCSW